MREVLKCIYNVTNTREKVKGILVKIFLASDHKSFTIPHDKILDQNEMKYFVNFEIYFHFAFLQSTSVHL